MTNPWTSRVLSEHRAGNLTHAFVHVLLTLRTYCGGGAGWPSQATIAKQSGCCVRTVQRALAAAQDLGLVTWVERRVKVSWRWLRTSNLYRLHQPPGPVEPRPWLKRSTKRQSGAALESKSIKKAAEQDAAGLLVMLREASKLPDLLAMRRAAFANRGVPLLV